MGCFSLELWAGSGQWARASGRGDLLTAFVPLPSPPTAPLSKHQNHKVFTHAFVGDGVVPVLPYPPEGLPCFKWPCPCWGWAPGVLRGVQCSIASARETLLVVSTVSPAMPAGKPGVSKSCSWAHMSLCQCGSSVHSSCWETANLDKVLEEFWWVSAACRGHGTWKECEKWMEIVRCTVVIQRSCLSF